jgi:hypothetical protein
MIDLLNNSSVLVILAGGAVAFVGLLAVILVQQHRISQLQTIATPKYGFLGKPLVAGFIALVMVGGAFVSFQSMNNTGVLTNDKITVFTEISTSFEAIDTVGNYRVTIKGVPVVDGVAWGKQQTDSFNLYWTITGPVNLEHAELLRTRVNISSFDRMLPAGNYKISVDVVYKEKRFTQSKDLILP